MKFIIVFLNFLSFQVAHAWSTDIGIGENYTQTAIENTSAGSKATYAGYGFNGELRLKLSTATASGGGGGAQGPKASPELFIAGGSLTQQNSSSSVGFNRKCSYVGGGIDFSFENFFVGGQYLNDTTSIETTTSTSSESYAALGVRLGYRGKIGAPASGLRLAGGIITGIGRSAASTSPVNIFTENSFFLTFQYEIFKSKGSQ